MQSFQGISSVAPSFGGLQAGQQTMQQPTMTGISVGAAPQQAQQRQLTGESIRRHNESATRKGQNVYWQVTRPGRELKLTGALAYVARPGSQYAGRQGNQRFVYWPRYRVAGTVQDIVNNFRLSGDPNLAGLTEQQVFGDSIDPLNPQHAQGLQNLVTQAGEAGAGTGARRPRHSLEEYIMVGQAIKAASKGATSAGGASITGGRGGGAGRGGAKDPTANRARLIQDFQQLMQQAGTLPAGQDLPRILNVTGFDPARFTKAVRIQPAPGPRATAIRPSIVVNGRRIPVPISAQPGGAANVEAFVQNVIGQSQYAQYAPQILQSFREQLQQRQSAGAGTAQNFMPQQVLGLGGQMGQLPGGFQAAPQIGQSVFPGGFQAAPGPAINVMSQLQQGAGSPGSPGSSGAGSPRTPRNLGAAGGFTLPNFGQGVSLQGGGGLAGLGQATQLPGVSLPGTIGGLGGLGTQLPTAGLPTVGRIQLPGASSGFPQIPLPGQQ